jgi:hypothetical protein
MKVNILEAHDRNQHFVKDQTNFVLQGLDECLKLNPLSIALQSYSPYVYVFAFPKTVEAGVRKLFWQPRLQKPKAQENSYLFRVKSNSDEVEICWILPRKEMWSQFRKGNITDNEIIIWSINNFLHNRHVLDKEYPDDLNKESVEHIYKEIAAAMDREKRIKGNYPKTDEEDYIQSTDAL